MTKPEGLSRESILAKANFKVETSRCLYPSISYLHLMLSAARQTDLLQAVKGKPRIYTYIGFTIISIKGDPFANLLSTAAQYP